MYSKKNNFNHVQITNQTNQTKLRKMLNLINMDVPDSTVPHPYTSNHIICLDKNKNKNLVQTNLNINYHLDIQPATMDDLKFENILFSTDLQIIEDMEPEDKIISKVKLSKYTNTMELKKNMSISIFRELVNEKAIYYLLENMLKNKNQFRPSIANNEDTLNQIHSKLQKYAELSKGENNLRIINYHFPNNNKSSKLNGRLIAQNISLQSMPREIRNCIANDYYDDLDIVNSGITILAHICSKYGIEHDKLIYYIDNRELLFEDLITKNKSYGLNKDKCKLIISSLLNSGYKDYSNIRNKPKWIIELKNQLQKISSTIYQLSDYQQEIKFIIYNNMKKGKKNHQATLISKIIYTLENDILMTMYNYLITNNIIIKQHSVFCFDGILCHPKGKINNNIIDKIQNYIKLKLSINIQLKIKPMKQYLKLPNDYKKYTAEKYFNDSIFNLDKNNANYENKIHQLLKEERIYGCSIILNYLIGQDYKLETADSKNIYHWNSNSLLWQEVNIIYFKNKCYRILRPYVENSIKRIKNLLIHCEDCEKKSLQEELRKIKDLKIKLTDGGNTFDIILNKMRSNLLDEDFKKLKNVSCYELPIKNGKIINLKTKKVKTRTKTDYFTFELNVNFNEKFISNHPNLDKFINPIFLNRKILIEYIQRRLGHCLSANIDHRDIMIWKGNGRNGKSCLINLMEDVMCNYFCTAHNDLVLKIKNHGMGRAEPHLVAIQNKRLAVLSEISEGDELSIKNIKRITGDDTIKARDLFQKERDTESFKPTIKLIFPLNENFNIDTTDQAILDRISIIPFDARFVDGINEKISNENEFIADPNFIRDFKKNHMDEFFTWLIQGCYLYFNDLPGNKKPKLVEAAKTNFISDIDSIQQFIDDNCEINFDLPNQIPCEIFYQQYKGYCEKNGIGEKLMTKQNKIAKSMLLKGFNKKRLRIDKAQIRCYIGLKTTPQN